MTKIQVISEETQRFGGLNFIVDSRTNEGDDEALSGDGDLTRVRALQVP